MHFTVLSVISSLAIILLRKMVPLCFAVGLSVVCDCIVAWPYSHIVSFYILLCVSIICDSNTISKTRACLF